MGNFAKQVVLLEGPRC